MNVKIARQNEKVYYGLFHERNNFFLMRKSKKDNYSSLSTRYECGDKSMLFSLTPVIKMDRDAKWMCGKLEEKYDRRNKE